MATKQDEMQRAFHQYQEEHDGIPNGTMAVVTWAVNKGILRLPDVDPHAVLADAMAQALRVEYATDPKTGRRYRRNHAIRVTRNSVQFSLWADIDSAPRAHMLKAFQQRRQQVVGDCIQLKTDVDVYNGKNPQMEQIQLILDFTDDVAEAEAADAEEAA